MSLLFGLVAGVLLGSTQALPQPQIVAPASGGGGGGGGGGSSNQLSPAYNHFYEFEMPIPAPHIPVATFVKPDGTGNIDYYEVKIQNFSSQVYPELEATRLLGYNGVSPGQTFMMTKGTEAVVRFMNVREDALAKATSVHLHGSSTHPSWDGWAEDITPVGFYKDYYYPNEQRARTLWYHDHAIDHTAENAYFGLAGQYHLHDDVELVSGLPQGKYDVPIVLNSKQYDATGQLVLPTVGVSMFGDIIHVNGVPWPKFTVEPRLYRFRMLDVAISRTFRIYFVTDLSILEGDSANHIPFTVVGSDSGRTSAPVVTTDMYSAIAERWEIVFDFTPFAGTSLYMKNFFLTFADTAYTNTNQVMRFDVGTVVTDDSNNSINPAAFSPLDVPAMKDLNDPDHIFTFERTNGMWKINGVTFNDINNRVLARPPRGTVELWQLVNMGGGWSHPIHVHLVDFSVVQRTKGDRGVEPYELVAQKDVVLLGEQENIWVLAEYAPWEGLYMFHCHNLVHEDDAMMGAFNVSDLAGFNYTPNDLKIVDPLDPRFISMPLDDTITTQQAIDVALPKFAALGAYQGGQDRGPIFTSLAAFYATATSIATDTEPVASEGVRTPKANAVIARAEALPTPEPKI